MALRTHGEAARSLPSRSAVVKRWLPLSPSVAILPPLRPIRKLQFPLRPLTLVPVSSPPPRVASSSSSASHSATYTTQMKHQQVGDDHVFHQKGDPAPGQAVKCRIS